jgi:hypothetical protein
MHRCGTIEGNSGAIQVPTVHGAGYVFYGVVCQVCPSRKTSKHV